MATCFFHSASLDGMDIAGCISLISFSVHFPLFSIYLLFPVSFSFFPSFLSGLVLFTGLFRETKSNGVLCWFYAGL